MAVAEWVIPFERLADEVEGRIGQRPFIEHTGGGIWAVFLPVLPDDKSGDIRRPWISVAIYLDDGPATSYEVSRPTLGVFPSWDGTFFTDIYTDVDSDSPVYKVYEHYEDTFLDLVGDEGRDLLNHDEMADYVRHVWDTWVGFRGLAPEGVATGLEVGA